MGEERHRGEALGLIRLHFVVEGQTEETFLRDVLAPELAPQRIYCDAHRITTGRRGGKVYRGGHLSFQHLRKDLMLWMKQDSGEDSWFTTMIDLYRLPPDFPGYDQALAIPDPLARAELLEQCLQSDLNYPRLLAYIQVHEFESLLFSDPQSFSVAFPGLGPALAHLDATRKKFATPEHINLDAPPSKRICALIPQYEKPSSGPLIAKQIGLSKLRAECHHFDQWLKMLETSCRAR